MTRRSTLLRGAALRTAAVLALLSVSMPALAATRYWVGGTGNFTDASHWSASSGGAGGASVPGSGDDAHVTAASGTASVRINQDVTVRDFVVEASASGAFVVDFGTSRLQCLRDCLFLSGRIDQGLAPGSRLTVGEDLDTAECDMNAGGDSQLSIELIGTGTWRYSLAGSSQPVLWNLVAAQPGQTTTLRPVGAVPIGTDIDVENQLSLGNATSVLDADFTEANSPHRLTIEIHTPDQGLGVLASGARVSIDAFEHEMTGQGPGIVQSNINFEGLVVFDLNGWHNAPPGGGPTWLLSGPLDVGGAMLTIEKTTVFDTEGYDINAGSMVVGGGSLGTAELLVPGGHVSIAGTTTLGVGSGRYGRIRLEGGRVSASDLEVRAPQGRLTGTNGSLELLGSAPSIGTVYYVSESGNDNNNGLSAAQPFRTFGRGMGVLGSGTTVLFERGDAWDLGNGTSVDANGGAVGAYGSGAAPLLQLVSGGTLDLAGGRWTMHDMEIEFGTGSAGGGGGGGGDPEPPAAPVLLQ